MTIVAAMLAALVLGGIGGYVGRGLALSTPTTPTVTTPRPFVQIPFIFPTPAAAPSPLVDPEGRPIPI